MDRLEQILSEKGICRELVEIIKQIDDSHLISVSEGMKIIYFNSCFREALGIKENEAPPVSLLELIHPKDRARLEESLSKYAGQGKAWKDTFSIRGPEEEMLDIDMVFMSHNELDIAFGRPADQSMADILGNVSFIYTSIIHEIKNPLAGIRALIEAMTEEITRIESGEVRPLINEYSPRILSEIDRLTSLLNSIKYLSKPRARLTEFYLSGIIGDVQKIFESELEKHGINLISSVEKNIFVKGDRDEIMQVIINLLTNSVEALNKKGDPDKRIEIELKRTSDSNGGGKVKISVKDNGPGFDPGILKDIERRFFIKKKGGGASIGLLIVNSILARYSSKLDIETVPTHGTTVSFELPISSIKKVP